MEASETYFLKTEHVFLIITFLSAYSGEIKRQEWQKKRVEGGPGRAAVYV